MRARVVTLAVTEHEFSKLRTNGQSEKLATCAVFTMNRLPFLGRLSYTSLKFLQRCHKECLEAGIAYVQQEIQANMTEINSMSNKPQSSLVLYLQV